MNTIESEHALDRLIGLFPKWSPTREQLELWRRKLEKVDIIDADKAIDHVYTNNGWYNSPNMKNLMGYITTKNAAKSYSSGTSECTTFLICTRRGSTEIGVFCPVHERPGGSLSATVEAYRAQYGGEWEARTNTTWRAMMNEKIALRKENK